MGHFEYLHSKISKLQSNELSIPLEKFALVQQNEPNKSERK